MISLGRGSWGTDTGDLYRSFVKKRAKISNLYMVLLSKLKNMDEYDLLMERRTWTRTVCILSAPSFSTFSQPHIHIRNGLSCKVKNALRKFRQNTLKHVAIFSSIIAGWIFGTRTQIHERQLRKTWPWQQNMTTANLTRDWSAQRVTLSLRSRRDHHVGAAFRVHKRQTSIIMFLFQLTLSMCNAYIFSLYLCT